MLEPPGVTQRIEYLFRGSGARAARSHSADRVPYPRVGCSGPSWEQQTFSAVIGSTVDIVLNLVHVSPTTGSYEEAFSRSWSLNRVTDK